MVLQLATGQVWQADHAHVDSTTVAKRPAHVSTSTALRPQIAAVAGGATSRRLPLQYFERNWGWRVPGGCRLDASFGVLYNSKTNGAGARYSPLCKASQEPVSQDECTSVLPGCCMDRVDKSRRGALICVLCLPGFALVDGACQAAEDIVQGIAGSRSQTDTSSIEGYKVLFENPRVRVSDFRLAPGRTSVPFKSEYPAVRWQVGDGLHKLSIDRGDAAVEKVYDKQVFWQDKGTTWSITNDRTDRSRADVYRQMIFEIKQPPKYSEEKVAHLLKNAIYTTNVGTELLFENKYCRVWDFYLEPGGPKEKDILETVHHHTMDYVFAYVAPGRLLGYYPDGKPGLFDSVNEDDTVTWFDIPESAYRDRTYAHGGRNGYDDKPMREYLVELK
eukprot:gnl/TRDRNA2_/TRDRNA2_125436_c0_seq3.p1 gnl/TRDRNA2_/TRDRNA2_125436_c0~~gnl/TRDRNA2_/TRDRNA2_125436_c0_seq3.p1  ORF type:complete len:389 (+),score=46.73 gnl/TRDRNA2_/TRDRNA2_125436_c0_seq3:4-1170(+)